MLREINNIFKKFLSSSSQFSPSRKAGTLFEVWICLRIADELNQRGMNPLLYQEGYPPQQIKAKKNNLVQSISFKASPGKIGSGNGCFVVFDWHGVQHEIQISIEFQGRSGSLHEIDVSIIPSLIADDIRTQNINQGGYPIGAPKLSVECKDKKNKGSKDEARNFLARLYDIHFLTSHPVNIGGMNNRIYSSRNIGLGYGARRLSYNKSFQGSFNVMCHSGIVVSEAVSYLNFFNINTHQKLTPGSNEMIDFIRDVVDYISNNAPD